MRLHDNRGQITLGGLGLTMHLGLRTRGLVPAHGVEVGVIACGLPSAASPDQGA